ncbi:hypothetical protein [Streptomyces sp. NPDC051109]|uniref:hypothetical protein n=1 Tax=Streptomyces sp. NPDC051109 TaxID=3365642 RepID=UPI00379D5A10
MSAGIRAAGQVTASLMGRYRPQGVPRVGSAEERGQAYRRFLDAVARVGSAANWLNGQRTGPQDTVAEHTVEEAIRRLTDAGDELLGAMSGIRLCAPAFVLEKAEALTRALPNFGLDRAEFQTAQKEFLAAQSAFLDVARHDLGYNPKWYSVGAWWTARTYRKQAAGSAGS